MEQVIRDGKLKDFKIRDISEEIHEQVKLDSSEEYQIYKILSMKYVNHGTKIIG